MSQIQLLVLMCLSCNDQPITLLDVNTINSSLYKRSIKELEEKDIIIITDDILQLTDKGSDFVGHIEYIWRKFRFYGVIPE